MHISVRGHIGHTAAANFYNGPVKSLCSLLGEGKCLSKRFRNNLPIFVLLFKLNGGLNHIICCFLLHLILFRLVLLLLFLGRLYVSVSL